MSVACFYVTPANWGDKIELDAQETGHAHVLRLKTGDEIQVMDGHGRTAFCRIEEMTRSRLLATPLRQVQISPPESRCILALALSKAVRRDFFMEKAAELGAWKICLWQADFSQGRLAPNLVDGLRKQLIAGLKQSRNPWLPGLDCLADAAEIPEWSKEARWRLLPWENQSGVRMLEPSELGKPGTTAFIIGPEGGFSERELNIFRNCGFDPVSLGARILRCETAAVLCLGLQWWAAQLPGAPNWQPGSAL